MDMLAKLLHAVNPNTPMMMVRVNFFITYLYKKPF